MVSVQFVSHSIESWFDVKIEAALDSGLNLGRAALDESLVAAGRHRRAPSPPRWPARTPADARAILTRAGQRRDRHAERAAAVGRRQACWSSAAEDPQRRPDARPADRRRCCSRPRMPGGYARSEGGSRARVPRRPARRRSPARLDTATGLRLRVVVAVPGAAAAPTPRYLQLMQAVPRQPGHRTPRCCAPPTANTRTAPSSRTGLRKMYIGDADADPAAGDLSARSAAPSSSPATWRSRCWCWPRARARWPRATCRRARSSPPTTNSAR